MIRKIKSLQDLYDINDEIMAAVDRANGLEVYYRGQRNSEWDIRPAISRIQKNKLIENEEYERALQKHPELFSQSQNHLGHLSVMQHYGIPTRLIDITEDILVALFFALDGQKENDNNRAMYWIIVPSSRVKTNNSDAIEIVTAMAALDDSDRKNLLTLAKQTLISTRRFNRQHVFKTKKHKSVHRLLHEVRKYVRNFEPEIVPSDLLTTYAVKANNIHQRLIAQSGSFLTSGDVDNMVNEFSRENVLTLDDIQTDSFNFDENRISLIKVNIDGDINTDEQLKRKLSISGKSVYMIYPEKF